MKINSNVKKYEQRIDDCLATILSQADRVKLKELYDEEGFLNFEDFTSQELMKAILISFGCKSIRYTKVTDDDVFIFHENNDYYCYSDDCFMSGHLNDDTTIITLLHENSDVLSDRMIKIISGFCFAEKKVILITTWGIPIHSTQLSKFKVIVIKTSVLLKALNDIVDMKYEHNFV